MFIHFETLGSLQLIGGEKIVLGLTSGCKMTFKGCNDLSHFLYCFYLKMRKQFPTKYLLFIKPLFLPNCPLIWRDIIASVEKSAHGHFLSPSKLFLNYLKYFCIYFGSEFTETNFWPINSERNTFITLTV